MKKLALSTFGIGALLLTSCVRTDVVHPVIETYAFSEDFNNNINGWNFSDAANYASGFIAGGTYRISYQDDYFPAYYVSQTLPFNRADDFIIETKMGSDNNMGLLFGYNDAIGAYGYSLTIDYDGNFALYDEGGNGYGTEVEEIYPLSSSSVVRNAGDWNTVRIEQHSGRWYVSINGYEVFNMEAQNLRGTGVGYVLMPFTEAEADYLDVAGYY